MLDRGTGDHERRYRLGNGSSYNVHYKLSGEFRLLRMPFFGAHPSSVVALPLDANGAATTSNSVKISTGLCEPHVYVNDVGPDEPTVTPTVPEAWAH